MKKYTDQLDKMIEEMIVEVNTQLLKHSTYRDILHFEINCLYCDGTIKYIKLVPGLSNQIVFEIENRNDEMCEVSLNQLKAEYLEKGEVFDLLNYVLDII